MRNKNNLQILISELVEAEMKRGEKLKLTPLVELYNTYDERMFLQKARDYVWFYNCSKGGLKYG